MKRIKKFTATLGIITILVLNSTGFVYAQTAPEAPSAPAAPMAPAAPQAPEAPATPVTADIPATPVPSVVQETETEEVIAQDTETAAPVEQVPVNEDTTGGQTGGGNTDTDVVIDTGDANTNGAISNVGNVNTVATGNGSGLVESPGASVVNSGNGSGSTNSGEANQSASTTTNQDNSATIVNNLNQNSSTGDNVNNSNTGGSTTIDTGNANTSGSIVNMVNTNAEGVMISEFNIADDHMGDYVLDFEANCIVGCAPLDAQLSNWGNGENSTNNASVNTDSESATFQNNSADIENNMTLEANTGDNASNRNTSSDVDITTGNANIEAALANFANNNFAGEVYLGTVNIYGDLIGDIILPEGYSCGTCSASSVTAQNANNGDSSVNAANVSTSDDYILSQANEANIVNNVNIEAETGDNATSRNTGGANSIETGEANIIAQVVNIANNNIVGGDWWLVIVNEAGNWVGRILGAPEGANFAASQGTDVAVNENGDITVANNGNGADSTNSGSVSQTNNTTIEQSNNATIVNNVNLTANTGGNSASRNTGGTNAISTGDANVILNIINFVNNNVVGDGRLFVTLVNVFGSWTGDFVTPGTAQAEDNSEEDTDNGVGGSPSVPNQSNNSSSSSSSGGSGSGGSSSSSSSSDGSSTTVVNQTKVANYFYSSSSSTEEPEEEIALGEVNGAIADEGQNSVDINLAWGLLLIPLYFVIRFVRSRLAQ